MRQLLTSGYLQLNLVSDQANTALVEDAKLVAAWGSALNPNAGAFWVADKGANVATLYSGDLSGSPFAKNPLVVSVPGSPTGVTFNGTSDFQITSGTPSGPATFLFDGESGQVSGWNTNVPPGSTSAILGTTTASAVYKGLALANNAGTNLIYAANFHAGTVDVFDTNFQPVSLAAGAFKDGLIATGFAPFNIEDLNNQLYVTYAKQDVLQKNDMPGPGNGFVDVFNPNGTLAKSLIVGQPGNFGSPLNSPYGVALAPANFGDFSNDLLVANSGDGQIHAFDRTTGALLGQVTNTFSMPLTIDGLKDLRFGNGQTAGDANKLFFTAAPSSGTHGLFGSLESAQGENLTAEGAVFSATLNTAFNGTVATFADRMPGLQASSFTVMINWGDGQTNGGSVVTLTGGGFNVTGSHTYAQSGTFNARVTITDPMQNTAVAASQAVVTVAPLLMIGATLNLTEGASFSGTVATLSDTDGNQSAAAYTASVVWGDGATTTPTLTPNGTGFDIRATHTYTEEGNDAIVVHVTDNADGNVGSVNSLANVADASLSGTAAAVAATEGTSSTFTVATFTDADPNGVKGDYTAKIQWGDGNSDTGTISASGGGFVVKAAHTYADEATDTVTVVIADAAGGSTTTVTSTATVADADALVGSTAVVTPTEGLAVTGAVATFSDTFTGNTFADFTATIHWGDGATDTATVTGGNGLFSVSGNHTYADEGTFSAVVTLSDDAAGPATAMLARTIAVADGDALSASVVSFAPTEGLAFSGSVATISDVNTKNTGADFTASIDWGDGTTDTGAAVTITGSAGNFQVSGSHMYLEETTAPFKLTFADDAPGTAFTSATASLVVADASLTVRPATFSSTEHSSFTGAIATFTDADPNGTLADYKAMVDWGDGITDTGTVAPDGSGGYRVTGTHSYTEGAQFKVGVLVNDHGGAFARALDTANVVDFALHATAAASIQGTEGNMFSGILATFTDDDPDGGAIGEYKVSIDWGDGTINAGTVSGAGPYTVTGSHRFDDESTGVKVVITDVGGSTAGSTTTASVADADSLSGTGSSSTAHEGDPLTGTLATFTDTYTGNSATDFTATVDWGDGATTAGTVAGSGGSFTVNGSHLYSDSGTFTASVVLADDAAGAATATANYTAQISAPTITLMATDVNGSEHTLLSVQLATFTEAGPTDPMGNFNATIDWGDGGTSAGTITVNAGVFTISGAHTYADEGHYQVTVVAAEKGGNSATRQSAATLSEDVLAGGGSGTANQRWVNEQYNDLLGRSADAGGLAFWSAQIDAGANRSIVDTALAQSQEYRQDEVQSVFNRYLNRAADPGGQAFFAAYLQSHTVEQLSAAVAGSPEYFKLRGGGNDGFLDALYHDALGRPVDAGGRQYFDQLLASGGTTGQVAATLLASEEYLDDVVKGIYLQFLDRPADPGGVAFWASQLQHGARDEQVITAIAASNEDFGKTA